MDVFHLITDQDGNQPPWLAASLVRIDGGEIDTPDINNILEWWKEFISCREVEDGEYDLSEFGDWLFDNFGEYQESQSTHIYAIVDFK